MTFLLLMVATVVAQLLRNKFAAQGDAVKFRRMTWISFLAGGLLAIIMIAVGVRTGDVVSIGFGALWGYFAFRDFKLLGIL
jgi:cytochrome bd-type quinol oxidase subunit 1